MNKKYPYRIHNKTLFYYDDEHDDDISKKRKKSSWSILSLKKEKNGRQPS